MGCRKAFEIDLPAFLAAPRDPAWEDFRDHYPTCAACAAEVAAWTELETRLGAAGHPEPAALLRFADDPTALPGDVRRRVTLHLAGCRPCREELEALGRFDATASAARGPEVAAEPRARYAPHAAPARRAAPAAAPRRRSPLRTIGRVLWHPAFAWAAVMALALTTLLERHDEVAVTAPVSLGIDRQSAGSAPSEAPPTLADEMRARRADAIAKAKEEAKTDAPAPPPPPPPAERPAPEQRPARKATAPAETRGRLAGRQAAEPRDDREQPAEPETAPAAPGDAAPDAAAPTPPPAPVEGDAAPRAPSAQQEATAPPPPPASAPLPGAPGGAASGTLARRAEPLGAATATPPALSVTVQPGEPTSTIYVTLPEAARGGGALEVRIAAVAGERELRQRVTVASTSRIAAMSVPATWLVAGRYAVTLWREDRELGGGTLDVR